MRNKKSIFYVILLVLSWLGVLGVEYVSVLSGAHFFSTSIITLFLFAGVFYLLKAAVEDVLALSDKKEIIRRFVYAGSLALLFAVTCVMGWQLQTRGLTECGYKGKGIILIYSLFLTPVIFPFFNGIFKFGRWLNTKFLKQTEERLKNKPLFFACWAVIFACFIPVLLSYYPGVMGYDFNVQSIQALGAYEAYDAHHPMLHTWLISLALRVGGKLGSYQIGIAIYSVVQMLLLSAVMAYACVTIRRLTKKMWLVVLAVLFFGLLPYNSIFAVSVTKDVIFSALFLLFFLLWIERIYFTGERKPYALDGLMVFVGAFLILFRNNAIYALALFAPLAVLLSVKKERLRVSALCLAVILTGVAGQSVVRAALHNTSQEVQSEKYSVLMQQFARVGYFHGETMDRETFDRIDTYVNREYWKAYNESLADTVKLQVAGHGQFAENWEGNMVNVVKDWVKVGLQYPNEFIDAFGQLTRGYWFMDDVSFTRVYAFEEDRRGVIPTFNGSVSSAIPEGIEMEPVFQNMYEGMEKVVQENACFSYPVFSLLFRPAFYCWSLVTLLAVFIYTKKREKILLALMPLSYFATLLLGPTVQARYVYPLIIIMPVLVTLLVNYGNENVEVSVEKES